MAESLFPLLKQVAVTVGRRIEMPTPPTEEDLESLCAKVTEGEEPSAGILITSVASCSAVLSRMRDGCGHLFANGSAWIGADACAGVPEGPTGFVTVAPSVSASADAASEDRNAVPHAVADAIARPALTGPPDNGGAVPSECDGL